MNFIVFQTKHLKSNIINQRFNALFTIVFLSIIIFSYTENDNIICSFNIDCNDCDFCGEEDEYYNNCNYYNIFCKGEKQYFFSPRLKEEYDIFFRKDEEINSLCGKEKKELNIQDEPFKILEINKNNYPEGKLVHCAYSFNNLEKFSQKEPYIVFEIISNENNLDNKINFKIIIEHTTSKEEKKQILIGSDNFIDKNIIEESLFNTEELLIFIDILNINYDGDENLEIKFKLNKKSSEFDLAKILLYGIIIFVFLVIIVIILIKICCPVDICKNSEKKKEKRPSRQINANTNENYNIIVSHREMRKEIKKKINYLSNKVLKNDFYSEKMLQKYGNKCSICFEEFIDGKSQISITPCEHIFHSDCIKKWIEADGLTPYCPNCKYYFIKKEDENNSPIMLLRRNMRNNNLRLNINSNNRLHNNENNTSHLTA